MSSSASSFSSRMRFQSALENNPLSGISWIIRKPRPARSTIVAVTSTTFARSSISVPIWPGRTSSGGANSTGASASPSPKGTASSSPVGDPMTWSIGEPRNRRSRPSRDHIRKSAPPRRARTASDAAIVPGFTLKARSAAQRSSRIGWGSGTTPFGMRDDHRHPLEGQERSSRRESTPRDPSNSATRTGSVEPWLPWKHVDALDPSPARARSRRPSRWVPPIRRPIAFQNSSSWSRERVQGPLDPVGRSCTCAGRRSPHPRRRSGSPWRSLPARSRRRRARRSRTVTSSMRVHAIVHVVVGEPRRDRAEDPVPELIAEVVVDRLGDPQVAVVEDLDLHVVVVDRLGGAAAPRRAPPAGAAALRRRSDERSMRRIITVTK